MHRVNAASSMFYVELMRNEGKGIICHRSKAWKVVMPLLLLVVVVVVLSNIVLLSQDNCRGQSGRQSDDNARSTS